MLLILLTWIYMLFIFSVQGDYINRFLFKGKLNSIGESCLLGLVFQSIVVTVIAFFYRINIEYFCLNLFLTIVLAFFNRKGWIERIKRGLQWDSFCSILFVVIVLLSLARSSMLPFLIDNESYYIQSIQWLNEYGWVKGLANLHIFLSHGNPWHALQAAYNFNFISGIFNDINGFLICVVGFLWIDKINDLRKKNDYQTNRWLFFLPVFAIYWFQFVDAPSADLPLYLISLVIVYFTLNRSEEGSLFAIFLSVFLVFIKLSVIPILVLSLFLLNKKNWKIAFGYALVLGGIYVVKGIWLSGCPLAPYTGFRIPLPWTIPAGLNVVMPGDSFNFRHFTSNGLVNILLLIAVFSTYLVYVPMVLKKKKEYPLLLFFTAELVLILFTYAQFRFILPAFFYPFAYILSKIKCSPRILSFVMCLFILPIIIPIFLEFDYSKLTKRASLLKIETFQIEDIIKPSGITKYKDLVFEKKNCTNFEYYAPSDTSSFVYLTGNGPIPCVKTRYLRRMYKKTGCLPALIGKEIDEGFCNIKPSAEVE